MTGPPNFAASWRGPSRVSLRDLILTTAGCAMAVPLVYVAVRRGAAMAFALLLLPALCRLVTKSLAGLSVGLIIVLTLPTWVTLGSAQITILRLASLAAAVSLVVAGGMRLRLTDVALLIFIAIIVLGWLVQYNEPSVGRLISSEWTPVGFYLGARAVPPSRLPQVMFTMLLAGTVGALTVLYEYFAGSPAFVSPTRYFWNANASDIFRPGGVFGSPPSAATAMCVVLLLGLGCLPSIRASAKKLAIICLAICGVALFLTYTRAPLIGAAAGTLLMLWLVRSRLISPPRVAVFALVLALTLVVALPYLEHDSTLQRGTFRSGTLAAREGYWQTALPIVTESGHNLFVGVGTGVLETPLEDPVALVPSDIAKVPQAFTVSLHSEYVTTLVEQGLAGLAALIVFLLSALLPVARMARATMNLSFAALAASIVAIAIIMSVDTALFDSPSCALLMVVTGLAAAQASAQVQRPVASAPRVPPRTASNPA
jgi:O-antigen ligase